MLSTQTPLGNFIVDFVQSRGFAPRSATGTITVTWRGMPSGFRIIKRAPHIIALEALSLDGVHASVTLACLGGCHWVPLEYSRPWTGPRRVAGLSDGEAPRLEWLDPLGMTEAL